IVRDAGMSIASRRALLHVVLLCLAEVEPGDPRKTSVPAIGLEPYLLSEVLLSVDDKSRRAKIRNAGFVVGSERRQQRKPEVELDVRKSPHAGIVRRVLVALVVRRIRNREIVAEGVLSLQARQRKAVMVGGQQVVRIVELPRTEIRPSFRHRRCSAGPEILMKDARS